MYIKSLANRSNSIAVGSDGFTYIVGTSGTVWASYNVTVISLDQNGGINYSTTFGGNNADRGWGVAVDSYGSVAITGDTASATDFPTTTEALRIQTHGQDAFVTRLDSSGAIAYSTLLGGDVSDSGTSIAIDSQGVLYVVGSTMGINFINPDDSIKPDPGGWDFDVFAVTLVPVSATKYTMGYGTYVGGSGWDFSYATVGTVDENGNVYITGETDSPDFVGTSGTSDYDYQAFVVKVATDGTAYDCSGTTLSHIGQAVLAEVGEQDRHADQNKERQRTDHRPQHAIPEGAYLPAEMALQPGARDILFFNVIDDDADDRAHACKIRQRIQDIHDLRQLLQRLFIAGNNECFAHDCSLVHESFNVTVRLNTRLAPG